MEINKEQSIYETINLVSKELSQRGLAKDQKNSLQNYNYRGIDPLYDLLAPILSKYGLIIIPSLEKYKLKVVGKTQKGADICQATVRVRFTFSHVHNHDMVTSVFPGEALDSSDKATNKAMTAAFKYMAIQLFTIPINGSENDADNSTPEVVTKIVKDLIPPVDLAQLNTLYKEKLPLIPETWIKRIEEIVLTNKQEDLQKVYNYLLKLGNTK